jgi:hypothetical protein
VAGWGEHGAAAFVSVADHDPVVVATQCDDRGCRYVMRVCNRILDSGGGGRFEKSIGPEDQPIKLPSTHCPFRPFQIGVDLGHGKTLKSGNGRSRRPGTAPLAGLACSSAHGKRPQGAECGWGEPPDGLSMARVTGPRTGMRLMV